MPDLAQKFGPIHEGYDAQFVPDVLYVEQGDKVCFIKGGFQLTESVQADCQIVESIDELELIEREGKKYVKNGKWYVEGTYQRSDVENANKRKYSRKIWERIIANPKSTFMANVKSGGVVGHIEHPGDGRTDGNKIALKHLDFRLESDGRVWGRSMITSNTPGRELAALTDDGVRWGVSSRGSGSVGSDGTVNENDFQLETFDAVMRPSTPGAYPTVTGRPKVAEDDDTASQTDEADTSPAAPAVLFNADTGKDVVAKIKSEVTAPFVNANLSTLGGKERATILLVASVDDKSKWANGILENSRYFRMHFQGDGGLDMFSGSGGDRGKLPTFRKTKAKTVEEAIKKINAYIKIISTAPATTEDMVYDSDSGKLVEETLDEASRYIGKADNGTKFKTGNHVRDHLISAPHGSHVTVHGIDARVVTQRKGKHDHAPTQVEWTHQGQKKQGFASDYLHHVETATKKKIHYESDGSDTASSPEQTTEDANDATTCINEVTALAELDLVTLDESESSQLAVRLIKSLGRVNSLDRSEVLRKNKAHDLRDWLTQKLGEVFYRTPKKTAATTQLSESESGGKGKSGRDHAYERVVSALRQSVNDANKEAADQRELAESLQTRLTTAEAAVAREKTLREESIRQSTSSGLKLAETRRQLDAALSTIEELSAGNVESPVEAAVSEVVREYPTLEECRDLLVKAESPERVFQLAESFAQSTGGVNGTAGRARAIAPRPTLPQGNLLSEQHIPAASKAVTNDRGAKAAGQVLARMKTRTAAGQQV